MNQVAAVVVTYNRKELLAKNIRSLRKQTKKDILDILVFDNASTDGTKEWMEPFVQSGEIRYIHTGSNLGGAGGFHFGMKYAVEQGYQYLWLMDDDTIPTASALEELLNKDRELKGQYGFLSSKVLWKDDSICSMNIQKETKWKRLKDFNQSEIIQYASFVSLLIKAETVRRIGLPYREFFIWADDWEYTRRISKQEPGYFVPKSIVHHWCTNNVGADIVSAPIERIDRFNYMYRNDVVLYRQDGLEGIVYLTIRNLTHRVRILLKTGHKKAKWRIIRQGTREGKRFFPVIEYPLDVQTMKNEM